MNTCDECGYWQTEPDSNEYPKREGVTEINHRLALKMGLQNIGVCNRIGSFNDAVPGIHSRDGFQGRKLFLGRQQCDDMFENEPVVNAAFIDDASDWLPSQMLTAPKFGCVLFVKK